MCCEFYITSVSIIIFVNLTSLIDLLLAVSLLTCQVAADLLCLFIRVVMLLFSDPWGSLSLKYRM